jgi:hypothetical protein
MSAKTENLVCSASWRDFILRVSGQRVFQQPRLFTSTAIIVRPAGLWSRDVAVVLFVLSDVRPYENPSVVDTGDVGQANGPELALIPNEAMRHIFRVHIKPGNHTRRGQRLRVAECAMQH